MNRFGVYMKDWLHETRQVWLPRMCPDCRAATFDPDQREDPPAGAGVRCLTHLTQFAATEEPVTELIDYLDDVSGRLHVLGKSMRQDAQPPSVEQDASWIETLGWFAGSDLPLQLLNQLGDHSRS